MKINYICPCWSGWRRGGDDIYNRDRSLYLKCQLYQLMNLRHNLDLITIVVPKNPDQPKEFHDFLSQFPKQIQNTQVEIFEMENLGASYGGYHLVFNKYREKFDYYLLIEDDYVFVQHDFDKIMVELIEKNPDVGYLCSRVGTCEDGSPIASVSNGIVRSAAFEKIRTKYGYVPFCSQSSFSDAFRDTEISMADYGTKYRAPFYGFGTVAWFHHFNSKDLIVPVQMFINPSKFRETILPGTWPDWKKQTSPLATFTDNNLYQEMLRKNYWKIIRGWFDFSDIYDLAIDNVKEKGIFVEVGAWFGKSTAYLGNAVKKSNKSIEIFAVDTWEGSPESTTQKSIVKENNGSILTAFLENMKKAGLEDIIRPVVVASPNAASKFSDNSLDLVYIDASHAFDAVLVDIKAWYPKIKKNGIIAGHDYNHRFDVPKAVNHFFPNKNFIIKGNSWLHYKE